MNELYTVTYNSKNGFHTDFCEIYAANFADAINQFTRLYIDETNYSQSDIIKIERRGQ